MVPFMTRFNADMLVIGGGMVLSEQYFLPLIGQYMKANGSKDVYKRQLIRRP